MIRLFPSQSRCTRVNVLPRKSEVSSWECINSQSPSVLSSPRSVSCFDSLHPRLFLHTDSIDPRPSSHSTRIVLNATKDRNDHSAWRIPIALQFAWAGILVIGMLILPETPRFLLTKGKEDKARKSLSRLTGLPVDHPVIDQEVTEIVSCRL